MYPAIILVLLAAGLVWANKGVTQSGKSPDPIPINSMQAFGPLELPAVDFAHDLHTQTLAGRGDDCASCHPQVKDNFVFTFSGLSAEGKEEAKNMYHAQCVSCHRTENSQGRSSGPLEGECRSCHQDTSEDKSVYAGAGMDLALHAKHVKYIEDKNGTCGTCHHVFDPKEQELVHIQGQELGCRACHQQEERIALSSLFQSPDESLFTPRISAEYLAGMEPASWSQAAHLACVNCHLQLRETAPNGKGQKAPVSCRSCHERKKDPAGGSQATVPRLKRGQPDAALISPGTDDLQTVLQDPEDPSLMQAVPFDHKLHEQSVDTCRSCHHQSRLESCTTCHKLMASEKGGMISLDQAMHSVDSEKSCLGCHREKTMNQPECAGCHVLGTKEWPQDTDNCRICHDPKSPQHKEIASLSSKEQSALAKDLLLTRGKEPTRPELMPLPQEFTIQLESEALGSLSFPVRLSSQDMAELRKRLTKEPKQIHPQDLIQEMPRRVTIERLADQYGPVDFPHAQIAASLQKGIAEDSLTQAFHQSPFTLCQGCHHQSPPSANPPACTSCHGKPFAEQNSGRLGLKAAYHTMCMDCHDHMKITEPANTDCSACHEQKKSRIISDTKQR
jgi:hypothetical protein